MAVVLNSSNLEQLRQNSMALDAHMNSVTILEFLKSDHVTKNEEACLKSEEVTQNSSQKFGLFAQTAIEKGSQLLSEDYTGHWEQSCSQGKLSEDWIRRSEWKKSSHRKRTRRQQENVQTGV